MSHMWRLLLALLLGVAVTIAAGVALPMAETYLTSPEDIPAPLTATRSKWHDQRVNQIPPLDPRVLRATPLSIKAQPTRFADRLVRIDGRVLGVTPDGADSLLAIGDDAWVVSALYQGSRTDLEPGTSVSAVGMVSPSGTDMVVLAISPLVEAPADDSTLLAWHTLIVAAAFLFAAILIRVRGGRHRRRQAMLYQAVLAVLFLPLLAGCQVQVKTSVSPDGSGSAVTEIEVEQEQMDEILGLPNAQQFIDSWIADMGTQGVTVARGEETLRITRRFESISDFNSAPVRSGENWSYLQAIDMPGGTHFVYAGILDTAAFQAEQGYYDTEGRVYEELDARMQKTVFDYSVTLPGTMLGARGGAPNWTVQMGQSERMFAESVLRSGTGSQQVAPRMIAIWKKVLDWAAAVVAGMIVFALVAYPWRIRRTL